MKRLFAYIGVLSIYPLSVWAYYQRSNTGVGQVAVNVLDPVTLFSNFIGTACVVVGAGFLFATIIKYIEHKRSPLMVPISTVVFLLLAGLVLVGLPFLYKFTPSGIPYRLLR